MRTLDFINNALATLFIKISQFYMSSLVAKAASCESERIGL